MKSGTDIPEYICPEGVEMRHNLFVDRASDAKPVDFLWDKPLYHGGPKVVPIAPEFDLVTEKGLTFLS